MSKPAGAAPEQILRELKHLRTEIEDHRYAYYVLAQPTIPDSEFDRLFLRLQEICALP